MKKLNIFLCVCAVAAAGIMISCKNGTTEYVNITDTSNKTYYTVSGTMVSSATTGTPASPTTTEDVTTVDGTAYVSYYDSEAKDSNYTTYSVVIYDQDAVTVTTETQNGATTKTKQWGKFIPCLELIKIDGDYYFYIQEHCKYVKAAVEGSVGGKEFKLSIDYSGDDDRTNVSQAEKDNPTTVEKASSKLDLTFTRIN